MPAATTGGGRLRDSPARTPLHSLRNFRFTSGSRAAQPPSRRRRLKGVTGQGNTWMGRFRLGNYCLENERAMVGSPGARLRSLLDALRREGRL